MNCSEARGVDFVEGSNFAPSSKPLPRVGEAALRQLSMICRNPSATTHEEAEHEAIPRNSWEQIRRVVAGMLVYGDWKRYCVAVLKF